MSEMKLYLVRMVFSVSVNGRHNHFDEQFWVVRGEDSHQAMQSAAAEGKQVESDFLAEDGASISWKFEGIVSCIEVPEHELSASLFSNTVRVKEADNYLRYIHSRWNHLLKTGPLKLKIADYSSGI